MATPTPARACSGEYERAKSLLPELTGGEDYGAYQLLCGLMLEFELPEDYVRALLRNVEMQEVFKKSAIKT